MINNKDLFDLIAWPLREKKKEKEEKEVCAKKNTKKTEERGVMFQTKVENGTIYKSDKYRFCV